MQLQGHLLSCLLVLSAAILCAKASAWGFDDATLSIQNKKSGVGGGLKEKYVGYLQLRWSLQC